jgi:beta-lactamase class A
MSLPNPFISLAKLSSCLLIYTAFALYLPVPGIAQDLGSELQPLLEKHRGDVGLMVKNLDTGETYQYHSDDVMPTASLIKFPVLIELYRQAEQGTLSLDQQIVLKESGQGPGLWYSHATLQ